MSVRTLEVQPAARSVEVDDGGPLRIVEVPRRVLEFVEVGRLVLNVAGLPYAGFTEIAGIALSALRAVRLQAGALQTVDAATLAHAQSCIGISVTAAGIGAPATVQSSGFIDVSGMTAGLPIYAGADGQLTQTPPVAGFLLKLGHAVSATKMFVQIERSIRL